MSELPVKSALLAAVLGAALCFVPLFDLLGYESAAAAGAALGVLVLLRTAWLLPAGLPGPAAPPVALFLSLLPRHLLLVLPPALLLLANALRVRNCDPATGLAFWAVIPVVSVVAGQALGMGVAAAVPRRPWRVALALALVGAQTGLFLWRLAWYPSIQGHTWTFGWFAGSIYDEALSLPTSLLWARLGVLLGAALVVALLELAWRRRHGRPRAHAALAAGLLAAALGGLHHQRAALGVELDTAAVTQALGGRLESEHFVIWYGAGSLDAESRRLLVEDHEFRYAELAAWFDEDPVAWRGRKIESFVYPDRATQHRLMGSRNTLVARPWTHQMHIRWEGYGDTALAHELAHLYTAPFGRGPLQMSTRLGGLVVDQGLVEGLARAADAPPDELTDHQATRAMRELGLAPDLRRLSDPAGFWTAPGRRAYTVMGSFVAWLVQTRGIEPFKHAYGAGDFEGAYGAPVEVLLAEWEAWVDQVPLTEAQRALAGWRYRQGSIFRRVCARTMAELQRRADAAEARGEHDRALALREQIGTLQPGNPDHALDLARLQRRMGEAQAARQAVQALLDRPELDPMQRVQARELLGDLLWQAGEDAQAAGAYTQCLEEGLDEARARRLLIKAAAAADAAEEVRRRARAYMVEDERGRTDRLWAALAWSHAAPEDPVARYLVGRTLLQAGQYADARAWLDQPLPWPTVDDERALLLGEAALHAGQLGRAQDVYAALAERTDSSRVRTLAEEGARRAQWKARWRGGEAATATGAR